MVPRDSAACASYHYAKPVWSSRTGKTCFWVELSPLGLRTWISQVAVMTAIRIVDHQADQQPTQKPLPVCDRQRKHQQQATHNSQHWDNRTQWCAKRAMHFRMSA